MFMSVHKGEGGVKIVPNPVHVVCERPLNQVFLFSKKNYVYQILMHLPKQFHHCMNVLFPMIVVQTSSIFLIAELRRF